MEGAPARFDALTQALSSLANRLDAVSNDDIPQKALELVETNEKAQPDLAAQLADAKRALEDQRASFEDASNDLQKRIDNIKSLLG